MNNRSRISHLAASGRAVRGALAGLTVLLSATLAAQEGGYPGAGGEGVQAAPDATGVIATVDVNGRVDGRGAFFQSLGSNGRTCATCHVAGQAMSISAAGVRARFLQTRGRDPLFAAVDGANCPNAREGNAADHSLLLSHGLIRIFLPVPAGAPFTISVVHDPYGCAIMPAADGGQPLVSVYRRPLPTANLNFLSTIMFDGRETALPLNVKASFPINLAKDLTQQAADAVAIHAQGTQAPSAAQLADIVAFERGLFTAQAYDFAAGLLSAQGANGGPRYAATALAAQYYPGINDSLGADPQGNAFNPAAMTLYSAWAGASERGGDYFAELQAAARRRIAAGEVLFNSAPVQISNVRGLNDNVALGSPVKFVGTCTTCHDTPNTGNHSFPLPLDIGTSHAALPGAESDPNIAAGLAELSLPDVPVYEIKGCPPEPFGPTQPASFYTTDPGKALITGQCSDFNRGKGPILRGLAARAPYFHNGAAADLNELVNFYNQRFQMGLTQDQKADLIAFLNSL
jgi:cytochrome c peroxidase